MRTVGLNTLKNRLSEYVRLAAAGETVVITDGNREIDVGGGSPACHQDYHEPPFRGSV